MRYGLFFFLLILFSACLDEPDCLVNATNIVKINFKAADGTDKSVALTSISVSGLTTKFYSGSNVKLVTLPLDPNTSETTITFQYGTTTSVLKLTYEKTNRIISTKCGAYVYYSGLTVTDHTFSSVKVKNTLLYTTIASNVEIYF